MAKIVLALGGNALGETPREQAQLCRDISQHIVNLAENGNSVLICHGNGPQVGILNKSIPEMPLAELGAMTQGYIGYHLQIAIKSEFMKRKMENTVVSLVTQVEVDRDDTAFQTPTKPIGIFYTLEKAQEIMRETGEKFIEDSGRGWRKIVASPKPVDILEGKIVKKLISEKGSVVIAGGGGGIPVIKTENGYEGVAAVIDKDLTSAKIAEIIDADYLVMLTAVDRVSINFGKPDQKDLESMNLKETYEYISQGHFPPGSMLPKIQAAVSFVERTGHSSLIASLEKIEAALDGKTGTIITV